MEKAVLRRTLERERQEESSSHDQTERPLDLVTTRALLVVHQGPGTRVRTNKMGLCRYLLQGMQTCRYMASTVWIWIFLMYRGIKVRFPSQIADADARVVLSGSGDGKGRCEIGQSISQLSQQCLSVACYDPVA